MQFDLLATSSKFRLIWVGVQSSQHLPKLHIGWGSSPQCYLLHVPINPNCGLICWLKASINPLLIHSLCEMVFDFVWQCFRCVFYSLFLSTWCLTMVFENVRPWFLIIFDRGFWWLLILLFNDVWPWFLMNADHVFTYMLITCLCIFPYTRIRRCFPL
jgi:hypothetical protein